MVKKLHGNVFGYEKRDELACQNTHLDGDYAAFGYVTSGMDIVDKICADAEPIDSTGLITAVAQPAIVSISIHS